MRRINRNEPTSKSVFYLKTTDYEKTLEDFLREFNCEKSYKKIGRKIVLDYYDIVIKQPIGKLLFQQYCLIDDIKWHDYIKMLILVEKSNFKTEEDRLKFKHSLSKLFMNQNVKNSKSTNFSKLLALDALELSKENFDLQKVQSLIGDIHNYMAMGAFDDFLESIYFDRFLQFKSLEIKMASEKGFRIGYLLSSGGFAFVYLGQSKFTNTKFAMKCFDKSRIAVKKIEELILEEKIILEQMESKFVLNLICSFETATTISIVTNYMAGGDLRFHIEEEGSCWGLGIDRARFYAAEIVCGLLYLQSKNIIHFDLKPENILMDQRGHLRIGDLGLAKVLKRKVKLNIKIGTVAYMSPEMIRGDWLSSAVDWYSFGCILYEMIDGKSPFSYLAKSLANHPEDFLVLNFRESYSPKFNDSGTQLCKKLLRKNPKARMKLEIGENWTQEMKKNQFFACIDWNRLECGQLEPPFVPQKTKIYHDGYRHLSIMEPLLNWKPTQKNLNFYRQFCSGAQPNNWQTDVIESGLFNRMNVYH